MAEFFEEVGVMGVVEVDVGVGGVFGHDSDGKGVNCRKSCLYSELPYSVFVLPQFSDLFRRDRGLSP